MRLSTASLSSSAWPCPQPSPAKNNGRNADDGNVGNDHRSGVVRAEDRNSQSNIRGSNNKNTNTNNTNTNTNNNNNNNNNQNKSSNRTVAKAHQKNQEAAAAAVRQRPQHHDAAEAQQAAAAAEKEQEQEANEQQNDEEAAAALQLQFHQQKQQQEQEQQPKQQRQRLEAAVRLLGAQRHNQAAAHRIQAAFDDLTDVRDGERLVQKQRENQAEARMLRTALDVLFANSTSTPFPVALRYQRDRQARSARLIQDQQDDAVRDLQTAVVAFNRIRRALTQYARKCKAAKAAAAAVEQEAQEAVVFATEQQEIEEAAAAVRLQQQQEAKVAAAAAAVEQEQGEKQEAEVAAVLVKEKAVATTVSVAMAVKEAASRQRGTTTVRSPQIGVPPTRILFLQTGGTIDKDYPKTTRGWGFEIGPPALQRIIDERLGGLPSFDYTVATVCQKDSTEITLDDRIQLRETIEQHLTAARTSTTQNAYTGIVITHGTDTMADTANFLAATLKDTASGGVGGVSKSPPIVITGAMRPERFTDSDAAFNVGMAVAAVQTVPEGWIGLCMHGLVLPASDIARNLETGQFFRRAADEKEENSDEDSEDEAMEKELDDSVKETGDAVLTNVQKEDTTGTTTTSSSATATTSSTATEQPATMSMNAFFTQLTDQQHPSLSVEEDGLDLGLWGISSTSGVTGGIGQTKNTTTANTEASDTLKTTGWYTAAYDTTVAQQPSVAAAAAAPESSNSETQDLSTADLFVTSILNKAAEEEAMTKKTQTTETAKQQQQQESSTVAAAKKDEAKSTAAAKKKKKKKQNEKQKLSAADLFVTSILGKAAEEESSTAVAAQTDETKSTATAKNKKKKKKKKHAKAAK